MELEIFAEITHYGGRDPEPESDFEGEYVSRVTSLLVPLGKKYTLTMRRSCGSAVGM